MSTTTNTDATSATSSFRRMDESSAEQWAEIGAQTAAAPGAGWPPRCWPCSRDWATSPTGSPSTSCDTRLQTATRAEEAGADPEMVVAALCHDIGKYVSVPNHPRIAAEILRPYVRRRDLPRDPAPTRTSRAGTTTTTSGATPTPASSTGASPGSRWASASPTSGTRRASTPTTPRSPCRISSRSSARSSPGPAASDGVAVLAPAALRARARELRRRDAMRRLVMEIGAGRLPRSPRRRRLSARCSSSSPPTSKPTTSATCSRPSPPRWTALDVSTLVVVDGGDDGTEDIVAAQGAYCAALPVNMGQGVALRLGYELAAAHGAKYVVTLDADGQNDPAEIPGFLAPLLDGTADFVIGSRRLGTDETTDKVRMAGRRLLRHGHQRPDRPAHHRHVQRVPGPEDRGTAGRHPRAGPVPDGGAHHQRGHAWVADHGLSRRMAPAGIGRVEERAQRLLRPAVRPSDRAHLAARSPLT